MAATNGVAKMRWFQSMLASLMQNSHRLGNLGRKHLPTLSTEPEEAIDAVMSATGDVSSLIYAEHLLNILEVLSDQELDLVFTKIISQHDIDGAALAQAATQYQTLPSATQLTKIAVLAEPGWLNLFRRLNATKDGTVRLVALRKRLLSLIAQNQDLQRLDTGLVTLMRHWFNPGFLVLQPIDWSTPANILEKIIAIWPDFTFKSESHSTNPKAFFWLGQITNQTLKAIITPSHIPIPIAVCFGMPDLILSVMASYK